MKIVLEKVKPERDENSRKVRRERWWQYGERAPALYESIAGMQRVLVLTIVTQYFAPAFCPVGWVYAHRCDVFALDDWQPYAIIQSTIHEVWARQYSSSLETRLNYSPSDCFETFPFSDQTTGLAASGAAYYAHRQAIMLARQEGLTKTYNRFHAPQEESADIVELRRLHVALDQAVAAAYGWADLPLDHGFHPTRQGVRYTISESARRAVLDRLLALNHARYAAEVAAGRHDKGAGKGKGRGRKAAGAAQGTLFDD